MAYCIARALSWGLVTLLFESLSFNKLLDNLRRRLPRSGLLRGAPDNWHEITEVAF